MRTRSGVALFVGWVAGSLGALLWWPAELSRSLATGVTSALVAVAVVELVALWCPRQ